MSTPTKNVELLKHRLALELEGRKWEYRRHELQYLEAGQHLRSLNQLMWQVPGMAIAITGGLWYGATTVDSETARAWVFGFVATVDLLIVAIIWRLRALIQIHINHQSEFAGRERKKDFWKGTVITCWILAILVAAFVSIGAALNPAVVNKNKTVDKLSPCCNVTLEIPPEQCLPPHKHVFFPKKRPCTP